MADPEQAIFNILTNDAGVAALVVTRIYPNIVPIDATLPAIAYQRISASSEMAHDGPAGYAQARLQITMIDDDYGDCKALAAAVKAALNGYSGTAASQKIFSSHFKNEYDGYGKENRQHVIRQDYMIAYVE